MKEYVIGALVMALPFSWAEAQTNAPGPDVIPPGPLVIARIPGANAQWAVDYTYSNAPKPGEQTALDKLKLEAQEDPALAKNLQDPQYVLSIQNIRPVHISVVRTGNITHEEGLYEQGYTGEKWSDGRVMVERRFSSPALVATMQLNAQGDDFPDFDWIAKDNFIGVQTHDNLKCLVFKKDQYSIEGNFIGTAYAYVDFTTRLPEGYQFVFETRKYTILPPPSAQLSMPEDFMAAGKVMIGRIQRATPHFALP
jgi:hypothetical protein